MSIEVNQCQMKSTNVTLEKNIIIKDISEDLLPKSQPSSLQLEHNSL